MTATTPLPAHDCPLCGQPNHCAPAREGHFAVDCWCTSVQVDRTVLQRIAPSLQHRACLCPACVSASAARRD